MTAITSTQWTIFCDAPRCDASYVATSGRAHFPDDEARIDAQEDGGWAYAGGKDYCPAHTPPDEMRSKP